MRELTNSTERVQQVQFSRAVSLNVGGMVYKTSIATLVSDPNSMLAAMFSDRHDVTPGEDGAYFIDRDGTHFRYILNYLRDGKLICPSDELTRSEILAEAEFYQVQGIIDELQPRAENRCVVGSSEIVTTKKHDSLLGNWLPATSNCTLLYRASRDGWAAAEFHRRCDSQGATLTLLRDCEGYVSGGYTTKSWESTLIEKSKADADAFLFTLTNPSSHEPAVLRYVSDRHGNPGGIVCSRRTGPYFGTRMHFDLKTIQTDTDGCVDNFVDLGHGFALPEGQDGRKFLFGSGIVKLNELEVFRVQ